MPMPEKVALTTYRGDSFGLVVRVWLDAAKTESADLTGAEVNAQIRATPDSSEVIASFDVVTAGNAITLTLAPKVSATLEPAQVFDVEIAWDIDHTNVQTVLLGSLNVSPDVTRIGG